MARRKVCFRDASTGEPLTIEEGLTAADHVFKQKIKQLQGTPLYRDATPQAQQRMYAAVSTSAANAIGVGTTTYVFARAVRNIAKKHPGAYVHVYEMMRKTGLVYQAHGAMRAIKSGHVNAQDPKVISLEREAKRNPSACDSLLGQVKTAEEIESAYLKMQKQKGEAAYAIVKDDRAHVQSLRKTCYTARCDEVRGLFKILSPEWKTTTIKRIFHLLPSRQQTDFAAWVKSKTQKKELVS